MLRPQLRYLAAAIVCAVAAPLAGQSGPDNDPDGAPGYVNSVFHHASVDSINLYNGQLTIPIAIGPTYPIGPKLKFQALLTYNSRVTDYGSPYPGIVPYDYPVMPVVGNPALGIGWNFTLGAIKACKTGISTGKCYFGPDGSQRMFLQSAGGTYLKTTDGSQLVLHPLGSNWEMWDGDGNHYVFNQSVTGFDDNFLNYTHDFGIGRDGWYLTSLTDPFGNGYSVSYFSNVSPCWAYSRVCASRSMTCPVPANTWIPQTISLPGGRTIGIRLTMSSPQMIGFFDFPVFAGGVATTATWTLEYTTQSESEFCVSSSPGDELVITLQQIAFLRLPSAIGSYQFFYSATNAKMSQLVLPTLATVSYCYATYFFYHGRAGALPPGCGRVPPPSLADVREASSVYCGTAAPATPAAPVAPASFGGCPEDYEARWLDHQEGVVRRTEVVPGVPGVGTVTATTDYRQYAFPWGERGSYTNQQGSQTLTVVLFPPDVDGRRRAKGILFWSAPPPTNPIYPGDRTGGDVEERIYDSDPNATGSITMPACGTQSFCANRAVRVTQRGYEFDDNTPGGAESNFRQISEVTYYGPTAADGSCPSCSYHRVDFSPVNNTPAWEANGRHYTTETHSGNLGNDFRTITTVWKSAHWNTPPASTEFSLPNLISRRTESDGLTTLNRYFEYKTDTTANGFLIGSSIWDSTRQRTFLSCSYNDGHGNVGQEFSATYAGQTSAPNNACQTSYPSFPTVGVGLNSDAFGKVHTYQNGLRLTSRWMATPTTPASWYVRNFVRDPATGWVTSSSDTSGLPTTYRYDSLGRVTLITPPGGETPTSVSYPSTTQTIAQRNGGTGLTTYEEYDYDGLGRTARHRRLMPGVQYSKQFTLYDRADHVYFDSEWVADSTAETVTTNLGTSCAFSSGSVSTSRPSSAPGTYRLCFDPFGRPQQVVGSKFSSLATVDRSDGTVSYSDTREATTNACVNGTLQNSGACGPGGFNATTTNRKDAFGRLTSVTEPTNDLTSYTYDINGKLTRVTQTGLPDRTFGYDPAGFLRAEFTPEKGSVTYSDYGSLGNLRQKTENDGTLISYLYDFAGRLACQGQGTVATGGGPCPVSQSIQTLYVQNSYDGNGFAGGTYSLGKLTQRIGYNPGVSGTPSVTDKFTYSNPAGRLSKLSMAVAGGAAGQVDQTWGYNSLGLVAQHAHARPLSGAVSPLIVSTAYDAALPAALYINGIPSVTGVGYAPAGALRSYTTGLFSGKTLTTTITPDASLLSRPASIATSGSVSLSLGSYTYDGAGNIKAIGSDTFSYDSLSRLASATLFGSGSASYTYDRFGNLLTKAGVTLCTTTCANNRLPAPWLYNGRGNLIHSSYPAEDYTYDSLDRTTAVSSGWSYAYDGASERVVRTPPSGQGGDPTYTFRDEASRVSAEYSGASPSADNIFLGHHVVASYANASVAGNDRVWAFYVSDHLGTPRFLTDASGSQFDTRKYWPFGEQVTATSVLERVRFAAMERDPEAGVGSDRYYDHARHYGSLLGRFLSPDKLQGKILDPQSWNRYSYAANDPLKHFDPDGKAVQLPAAFRPDFEENARTRAMISQALSLNPLAGGAIAILADSLLSFFLPTSTTEFALNSLPIAAESVIASGSVLTTRGTSVLGHFPEYLQKADELGARRFNIPTEIWNRMSATDQWVANQKFLDRLIKRRDEVVLSNNISKIRPGSSLEREVRYLLEKGYQISDQGWRLINP